MKLDFTNVVAQQLANLTSYLARTLSLCLYT